MMRMLVATVAALSLLVLANVPGQARPIYPWCAVSSADGFTWCDFATFEQCRRFAVGDGVCENNPWYRPAPLVRAAPYRARKKLRHH